MQQLGGARLRAGPQEEEVEGREEGVREEARPARGASRSRTSRGSCGSASPPAARSGDVVVRLERAERRARRVPARAARSRGELGRAARDHGPNGSGKTTLLDALLGRLPLAAGTRWAGPGVVLGELEQRRATFAGDEPLLDAFVRRERAARRGGAHAAREVRPRRRRRAAGRRLALTGRAHARRPRASLGARRQLPRARRADEPPRRRGDRGARAGARRLRRHVLLVTHDRVFLERFGATSTVDL